MQSEALINKYRPSAWSQVVGHVSEVASLRDSVVNKTSHGYIFSGKPGSGKTSLARLLAKDLGAEPSDIDEIPAAVYTSVDDMRSLTEGLRYRPLNSNVRVIILDECHRLSKPAFDSLLKMIEEPPYWVFWMLCTTELNKIPQSVKRRCMVFDLKEVSKNVLTDFLDQIAIEEGLTELDAGVLDICAREAHGSPGQALANLALCTQAKDRSEAAALLHAAVVEDKDSATGELVRGLMAGAPWEKLQPLLFDMREVDAESVRYAVRGYLGKVLLETGDPGKAAGLMTLLEPFATPFYHISDVAVAVGKIVFEQS